MRAGTNNRKGLGVARAMLMSMVLTAVSVDAAGPLPPSGPPAPILTGISISGPLNVDMQTSAQFSCVGIYSDGTRSALSAAWSVDSVDASISTAGLLAVGTISADQSVTVTASQSGFSASLNVTLLYVAPVLTGITITGASVINEETSVQYSCTATYSDGSSGVVVPAWSENAASTTINASGLFSAGSISSDQNVTITASYGGQTDTHAVLVKYVPPEVVSLVISGPLSMNEGTLAQFVCTATYTDGSSAVVAPLWSENSSVTIISSAGQLRAGNVSSDQSVIVSASFSGKFDTQVVTIKYVPPVLVGITVSGATRLDEGTSAQYICTASYSDGTSAPVSASWSENSAFASFSASGVLVAGDVSSDQSLTVTASFGGKSDTLAVVVAYVAPPITLTAITISGPSTVAENTTAQYVCSARYSDGSIKSVAPVWSENSAYTSMDGAGVLSIQNVAADETVTLTARFEGKVGVLAVAIQMVGDQVVFPLSGFEGKTVSAELWDETAQQMRDLGQDVSPQELVIENVTSGQWYWLGVRELDAASGNWILVFGSWIIM